VVGEDTDHGGNKAINKIISVMVGETPGTVRGTRTVALRMVGEIPAMARNFKL